MPIKPEPAVLLIADISGYTGYLAGVELDHAMDILADVIDTIVGALRPPFHLSKLEGDAAFVYLPAADIDGMHLQNVIEATYYEFRRRLRNIMQTSICECDACRQIPNLDLKFVVHHGLVAKQMMSGHEELIGRDVILVHRLLKNNVASQLGDRPYVLYTDAFIKAAGIDPAAQGLAAHHETIDIIGEVLAWLTDLDAAWRAEEGQEQVRVTAEDAILAYTMEVDAPRQMAWEYLTAPRLRVLWATGTDRVDEMYADGRRGAGMVNHCIHGPEAIVEEILDWRPPNYLTRRYMAPAPGAPPMLMTVEFSDLPNGGTRVEERIGLIDAADAAAAEAAREGLERIFSVWNASFVKVVNAAAAAERAIEGAEPMLPVSAGRFLTEPILSIGATRG
jgi:uncharacterized protein YndB with AHSA1/START domain